MDLIQLVMKQLGIDESQAKGGLGLIFEMVKDKLGPDDFQKVCKVVPGIDDMLRSATIAKGGGGLMEMVGALASKVVGGNLGNLTELIAGFEKLGLKPEMITKFIPVVMKFIEERGGVAMKDLLGKILKA